MIENLYLDCRRSLQFFDHFGNALHKIIIRENSDIFAYDSIIEKYQSMDQSPKIEVQTPKSNQHPLVDSDIDLMSFQKDWLGLTNLSESSLNQCRYQPKDVDYSWAFVPQSWGFDPLTGIFQ